MTLRFLGPLDPGTLQHSDPGTLGFLDLFPPPPPPNTFSYLLLSLLTSSYTLLPPISSYFLLVWYGLVCQMTSELICEEILMLFLSPADDLYPKLTIFINKTKKSIDYIPLISFKKLKLIKIYKQYVEIAYIIYL